MKKWLWVLAALLVSDYAMSEEIIVKVKPTKSAIQMMTEAEKIADRTYVIQGNLKDLQLNPNIEWAEPNFRVSIPETFRGLEAEEENWGLKKIQVDKLWESGVVGDNSIIVAVIDTGVDYDHPALKNHIWTNTKEIADNGLDDDENGYIDDVKGWDFYNGDKDPKDDHNHGTHCAGVIGGDEVGVTKKVQIMPLKFLSRFGSGSTADAVKAIDYAIKNGADILSNSWGGGGRSQALADAIKRATDAGVIVVAAAGNSSSDNDVTPSYPASYPDVISVAATDQEDKLASFSNYGKETVHVAAPGVDIYSTVIDGKYKSFSGTSMATPHVSGVAVLLLSKGISPSAVKDILMKTGDESEFDLKIKGKGRINACHAYFFSG